MSQPTENLPNNTAIVTQHPGRILPVPSLTTIASFVLIGFVLYAMLTHMALRFYASFLFTFYSWTEMMWISVMMLGAFQTLIMIPLRVINLRKSANIQEFQEKIQESTKKEEQGFVLKKKIRTGENVALFYIVNMSVQAVSYLTIGRLFLIDFYNKPLDPSLLYRWVPYPIYPIQDRIYYLPYPWFTYTQDFGFRTVLWVWAVISIVQIIIYLVKYLSQKYGKKAQAKKTDEPNKLVAAARKYSTGYLLFFLVLSYILIRNFPMGWQIFYFTGDVAIPNPSFNLFTAIVATLTIIWLALPKIRAKAKLAEAEGIEEKIIYETQKDMLKNTVISAMLIGLAAFFITNQIPSAFELSIFTFEMIVLLSPFTLDRIIMNNIRKNREAEKLESAEATNLPEKTVEPVKTESKSQIQEPITETAVKTEAENKNPTNQVKPPLKGEIKF